MDKVPEYNERDFYDRDLRCTGCQWKGKGTDAVVIDFFGVTKSREVHCPECDRTIAIVTLGGGAPPESANDFSFQTG